MDRTVEAWDLLAAKRHATLLDELLGGLVDELACGEGML
jgi:hypothetical protein